MVPFVVIFRCILLINLKPPLNSLTSFAPSRQYKHSTDRKLLVIIFKSFKIYLCELTTFNLFFSFLLFLSLSQSFRLCCAQLQLFGIFREEIHTSTHTYGTVCERQKLWESQNAIENMSNAKPEWNRQRNLPFIGECWWHKRKSKERTNERASEEIHSRTHIHIYQPKQHSQPREPFRTYVTFKVTTTQQQQQPIATHTQIHSLSLARVIGWKEKWT